MKFVSGQDRDQITLLPDSVEDYVDENNSVRVIEAYVNSLNLTAMGFNRSKPNNTGRHMYASSDLLKLYIYGYINRIRSSRRLETETKRNLEAIWLLRKLSPDHKTIARFRQDNAAELKNVFKDFVKLCMKLDLYGKELETLDGSKFKAVNSKDRNFTVKKLQDKIARIDVKIEEYMNLLEKSDLEEETIASEKSPEEITRIITEMSERKAQYQEYINDMEQTGQTQKSLTDPDSRLMKANGKMDVCYNVQTVVDAKHKLISEFEATNKANDLNQITPMAEKAKEILETDKLAIVADAGYDSAQDIVSSMEQGVEVHVAGTDFDICVAADKDQGTEVSSHKDGRCVYNADRNVVICPMGKILYPGFYNKSQKAGIYYNYKACKQCTCKCAKDTRNYHRHRVPMAEPDFSKVYDDMNLYIKQIRIKPDKEIVRRRKSIAEHPFGTIKRSMDAGYCLMKGLKNVNGEFSLIFLAYNLKRVINILGCKKLIEGIAQHAYSQISSFFAVLRFLSRVSHCRSVFL